MIENIKKVMRKKAEVEKVSELAEKLGLKTNATTFEGLLNECNKLNKETAKVLKGLSNETLENSQKRNWIQGIRQKLPEIASAAIEAKQSFENFYSKKNTLNSFGLDLRSAARELEQAGEPVVLTKEDLNCKLSSRPATKLDSLDKMIGVYVYSDKSQESTSTKQEPEGQKIVIDGKEFSLPSMSEKDIIHTSINGLNSKNIPEGTESKDQCAILFPLSVVEGSIIEASKPGSVSILSLPGHEIEHSHDRIILCPVEMMQTTKNKNQDCLVIGCDGDVCKYIDHAVSGLGYKPLSYDGKGDMCSEVDAAQCQNTMRKKGYVTETHSKQALPENLAKQIKKCVDIVKCIRDAGLVKNEEDLDRICEQVGNDFNFLNIDGVDLKEEDLPNILENLHLRLKSAGLPSADHSELEHYYKQDKENKHKFIDANADCELYSISKSGIFRFRHGVSDRSIKLDNIEIHGASITKGTNGMDSILVVQDKNFTEKELGRLLEYDEADSCCRIRIDRKSESVAKIIFKTCFPATYLSRQKHNAIARNEVGEIEKTNDY